MSNEDISMVCNILLGITNVDKEIRMKSVNKLLELSNNLGALTFCLIEIASKNAKNAEFGVTRNGIMGFLYLEMLDASFSFDGVIGAFAMSENIFIIMLGLGSGAMFVRSMTIYLVKKGRFMGSS